MKTKQHNLLLNTERKLSGDAKVFVLRNIAEFKSVLTTIKELKEMFHIDLTKRSIYCMVEKYSPDIEKMRDKYLSRAMDIPIAIEKVRLERDEAMYELSQEIEDKKSRVTASLSCLKEAREELKGGSSLQFNQFNQFNNMTDSELQNKLKQVEDKIITLKNRGGKYEQAPETKEEVNA